MSYVLMTVIDCCDPDWGADGRAGGRGGYPKIGFSMSSCEQKLFVPCGCTHQMVSKTPTITFRLNTTPEFWTRGTRHFLRNAREASVGASRSSRRANHTTRRTSACRSRRVRADRAQHHALATRNKRAVATAAQASVQTRSTTLPRDF